MAPVVRTLDAPYCTLYFHPSLSMSRRQNFKNEKNQKKNPRPLWMCLFLIIAKCCSGCHDTKQADIIAFASSLVLFRVVDFRFELPFWIKHRKTHRSKNGNCARENAGGHFLHEELKLVQMKWPETRKLPWYYTIMELVAALLTFFSLLFVFFWWFRNFTQKKTFPKENASAQRQVVLGFDGQETTQP